MEEKMSKEYAIAFSNVKASELLNALEGIDDIPESWDEFVKDMKSKLKILIDKLKEEERKIWEGLAMK